MMKKKKNFEIQFYEELLARNPNFIQALSCLGEAYTRQGLYGNGLKIDQRLAALKPHDPTIHYNLACSLSLVGQVDAALEELKEAVLLGYSDFPYILDDPDLDNLRKHKNFQDFFKKIQRLQQSNI